MIILKFYFLSLSGLLKLIVTREHLICYTFWSLLVGRLKLATDSFRVNSESVTVGHGPAVPGPHGPADRLSRPGCSDRVTPRPWH